MLLASALLQRGLQQCAATAALLRFVAPQPSNLPKYAPADWHEPVDAEHAARLDALQGRWHITMQLPAETPLFIVGDVHGCIDEFTDMLNKAPPNAVLVCVGDLINKGPESVGCLRLARQRGVICVRGNHEESAIHWRNIREAHPNIRPDWAWVDSLNADDLAYLHNMPFTISFPLHNIIVVHAGLVPHVPLAQQHPLHMIKMRSLTPVPSWVQALGRVWRRFYAIATSTSQPPVPQYMASDGDGRPWASFWPAANPNAPSPLVVFGHDAKRRLQKYPGALGIDTGCLYGNGLTAWCSPENKLYEVASRCVHVQPGKKYVPPPPVEIIPQPVGLERKVEPNVGVAVAAATSTSTVAGRAA